MALSPKSRQALKAKAHALKPIILIGNKGLTPALHAELERALNDHELLKIKIACNDRDERKEMLEVICAHHEAELVQSIGNIGVLYRKNKDK